MLTMKTNRSIRASRNVKGFRALPPAVGVSLALLDAARLAREGERLLTREERRLWLENQWTRHFAGAAGPERVLPPSARSRQRKGK